MTEKPRPNPHQQVMLAALAEERRIGLITDKEYDKRAQEILKNK